MGKSSGSENRKITLVDIPHFGTCHYCKIIRVVTEALLHVRPHRTIVVNYVPTSSTPHIMFSSSHLILNPVNTNETFAKFPNKYVSTLLFCSPTPSLLWHGWPPTISLVCQSFKWSPRSGRSHSFAMCVNSVLSSPPVCSVLPSWAVLEHTVILKTCANWSVRAHEGLVTVWTPGWSWEARGKLLRLSLWSCAPK